MQFTTFAWNLRQVCQSNIWSTSVLPDTLCKTLFVELVLSTEFLLCAYFIVDLCMYYDYVSTYLPA